MPVETRRETVKAETRAPQSPTDTTKREVLAEAPVAIKFDVNALPSRTETGGEPGSAIRARNQGRGQSVTGPDRTWRGDGLRDSCRQSRHEGGHERTDHRRTARRSEADLGRRRNTAQIG